MSDGVASSRAARTHDLLRIDPKLATTWSAPTWVRESLERAPWVVVRRALGCESEIAIGVRGCRREERFAAFVRAEDVVARIGPYQLVALVGSSERPIERAARAIDAAARDYGIRWGPTGSYGFELASGRATTQESSDLDGIVAVGAHDMTDIAHESHVRMRARLASFAATCERVRETTGVRVDLEVQVRTHGVALAEYVSDADRMLAKTRFGPALVAR